MDDLTYSPDPPSSSSSSSRVLELQCSHHAPFICCWRSNPRPHACSTQTPPTKLRLQSVHPCLQEESDLLAVSPRSGRATAGQNAAFTARLHSPISRSGSGNMKRKPAAQLGCCYKTKALGGSGGYLSPSLDFQLCQDDQVFSANTSQSLPDTRDACDLSPAGWMCPLPVAPAKSSLLGCPHWPDLCLCALQKTPLAGGPQDLREDASDMRHQPPRVHEGSADSEKLTAEHSPDRDQMGNQPERGPCPPLPPQTGFSPDARPRPWTSWPWLSPILLSKELPAHIYPFFPGYPLLPPPYLLTYGPLPSAQCLHLLMPPPDTAYPTVAVPSLLMTAVGAGPRILQEKTPLLYSQCQSTSHTLCSRVRSRSAKDALTPGQAGVAAPAKRAPPGSRAGAGALPYPLKRENGKILYECNLCGKSFGQLSNLKVHLRVHSGERPFRCALCHRSFTQLAHLQKHRSVHTSQRPPQCRICHKRFSSSSTLKTHLRQPSSA
ncbi:tissue-resident T-cell transcription regulator protein ZNF683 [Meriones unguiculatus]|uniref:tissue-resident T-cell transcription regulator protein ZNF683 n=1 Tax=Meriones unguiculatus TaxID=10047 RepID=UPI00293E74C9|nr:tissue-resident T-cell transcription regulator protein ZNF683 [Meriones unguiculatus]